MNENIDGWHFEPPSMPVHLMECHTVLQYRAITDVEEIPKINRPMRRV